MKRTKFREPRSFTWRRNFIHIMNSIEDCAKRWAQSEKEDLDNLSELNAGSKASNVYQNLILND